MFESIVEVIPSVDYVSQIKQIGWLEDFEKKVEIFKKLEMDFKRSVSKSIISMANKGWMLHYVSHEKDQTQLLFRRLKNGA